MFFDIKDEKKPIIRVIGVGGGGSNAVNHMYSQGIIGVDFCICNTDHQAIRTSPVGTKIQLGPSLTDGLGAGSKPNIGKMACEESIEEIREYLSDGCKMLFVTAGMGGGTGTGAAPIIAKVAQDMDILTVGIVTLPFAFEGRRRGLQGHEGLEELKKNVDCLIVISNDKLRETYGNMKVSEAFAQADNILTTAAKGIAEIITVPGYVNVDFEDVNTVMRGSGVAIMGTGIASGDSRAKEAVDMALASNLLEDNNIKGAQHILINITSGKKEATMDEITEINEFVQEEAGYSSNLIWGNCYDEKLEDEIIVTIIATGFEQGVGGMTSSQMEATQPTKPIVVPLEGNANGKHLRDIGYTQSDEPKGRNTFEFDDVRDTVNRINKQYTPDNPYIKDDLANRNAADAKRAQEEMDDRSNRMRTSFKPKLSSPEAVHNFESVPAYLRRGVNLERREASNQQEQSRWSVGEEGAPSLRKNNSYLDDKVD